MTSEHPMRESPPLSTSFIEAHYPLTNVRLGEKLQKFGERQVGLVESDQGSFVYKIAESRRGEAGLRKDTAVFSALEEAGFHQAPKLILAASGESFVRFGMRFLYILEYIEGSRPEPSPKTYGELGMLAGKLHLTKRFPFETDFNTNVILEDLYKNGPGYPFGKEYRAMCRSLRDLEMFPKALIHTDISPANSIRHPDRGIIFIDWDDAGIGPAIVDLGAVLNEIIKEDTSFDEECIKAFFSSYTKERPTTAKELDGLIDATIFFALMYIPYGDQEKRWKRIQWLHTNKEPLEKMLSRYLKTSAS